jgi:hypothetical protein
MESYLIIPVFGCYHGKLPDNTGFGILSRKELSVIISVLGCYQGKLPDNQWLCVQKNRKEHKEKPT